MSVQTTKSVLHDFLTNGHNDVLALTGAWGTGKTHIWREALQAHKTNIRFKQYCYVSLFGINSMSELRMALFVKSTAVATLGEKLDFETVNRNWAPLAKGWVKGQYARFESVVRSLPHGSSVSLGIEALAPSAVRDTLICMDDFERQTSIKVEEVLGLITELKEERGCKIALIFNAEELANKDYYRAYKEKVVDYEVLFAPTVQEAFDLVFAATYSNREQVLKHVISLDITNVRILRKLRGVLGMIETASAGLHPNVLEKSIASAVLLCWCAYAPGGGKPSIEEIGSWNKELAIFSRVKEAEVPVWAERLLAYGFFHVDDLDLAIARVVERGYVEGSGFPELARSLDAEYWVSEKMEGFAEVWTRFWGTFVDDPEDFTRQLHGSAQAGIEDISVSDLNSTVVLLRQLERADLADDLIKGYVESHHDKPGTLDLTKHPFGGSVDDPGLRKAFDEGHAKLRKLPTLEESLMFMVDHSGYNEDHIEALKAASVEDYRNLFEQQFSGRKLSELVKWALQFNSGDKAEIGRKAREALEGIKSTNLLNEIRVGRYGV